MKTYISNVKIINQYPNILIKLKKFEIQKITKVKKSIRETTPV